MDLHRLRMEGWVMVDGIGSPEDLLALGQQLGQPVLAPNGELVKEIRRVPKEDAPPGSQSAIYGAGSFPLHTDTAFWACPVRYVLLRAYGDVRRPTTLMSFKRLLTNSLPETKRHIQQSLWRAGAPGKRFYCSMLLRGATEQGWRFDSDLMLPANDSARRVHEFLRSAVFTEDADPVEWNGENVVVISNWHVLHGRGPEPENEGTRIIERLYVR